MTDIFLNDSLFVTDGTTVPNSVPSSGPSLSLNFTTGALPSGATFARASTGTYYNASGVLSTAANDTARFDYNPSTLALRGILIEPTRTNLIPTSVIPPITDTGTTGNWKTWKAVSTAAATTSPDGASNGSLIVDDTTSNTHQAYINTNFTSGNVYTVSVFAKQKDQKIVALYCSANNNIYANFDLNAGAVTASGSSVASSGIVSVGGGWYRVYITFTPSTGSYQNTICLLNNNPTEVANANIYSGTGTGLYAFGLQTEQASASSSYIPTTTAAATRAADALSFTIPSGITALTYTFDDNSTQKITGLSAGSYTVPTNLNRPWIKTIVGSAS